MKGMVSVENNSSMWEKLYRLSAWALFGIVLGLSGTVLFQNGKIAGAVTHVFTDDPTMGYGIFAETMLEQCRGLAQEDGN